MGDQESRSSAPQEQSEFAKGSESLPQFEAGLVTWTDLVRFVRRNLWLIAGVSVAMSVLSVSAIVLLRPVTYEAVATLVIAPQRFRSALKPPMLPVQGYQRLLESNAVVAETAERLRGEGVIGEDQLLSLGDELRTRIFVSQRAEERTLAPMIEVIAEATTPELAASIANSWSETFLQWAEKLEEENVAPMLNLIKRQYEAERERLATLMQEEADIADGYQRRLDELMSVWDQKLVTARKRTEDLIAEHNVETRRLMEQFAEEMGLRLAASTSPDDREAAASGEIRAELEKQLLQILSLRTRLAQTPRLLILEKTISDDTLWHTMALSQKGLVELQTVFNQRLITEEANPVYEPLALQLSEIEIELERLSPSEQRFLQRFAAGLEVLQSERAGGLAKVLADRTLVMDDLERQRASEFKMVDGERAMMLEQIRTSIVHQRSLFEKLAENRNEAGLAEAEQALQDVRLGARAVPPAQAQPRGLLQVGAVGAFLGALLGLFIGVLREVGTGAV